MDCDLSQSHENKSTRLKRRKYLGNQGLMEGLHPGEIQGQPAKLRETSGAFRLNFDGFRLLSQDFAGIFN